MQLISTRLKALISTKTMKSFNELVANTRIELDKNKLP